MFIYIYIHIYIYTYIHIYIYTYTSYPYIHSIYPSLFRPYVSSGLLCELRSEGLAVALRPRLSAAHGEAQKGLSSTLKKTRGSQPTGKA